MTATTTTARSLLTSVYISKEVEDVIKKIKPDYIRDDVKQHAFLTLFEKEETFILDLHSRDKLRQYVVKTIYNTANFSEGKFQREHRRKTELLYSFNEDIDEDSDSTMSAIGLAACDHVINGARDEENRMDYEELIEACPVILDKVYWYNKLLLKKYMELGTYRAVSKDVGLPVMTVFKAVKNAQKQAKELLWK
jgi:DNA-directed RNA polymerase specialized sigma24 family protein